MASAIELLTKIESINYLERTKFMVQLGRESKMDVDKKYLVETLTNGGVYERFLALETVYGSRDVGVAIDLLKTDSKLLRRRAMNLIVGLATDDEILKVLAQVPTYLKIYGVKRLRTGGPRRKRPLVIDKFLRDVRNNNTKLFQALLLFGTEEFVREHLPGFNDRLTASHWKSLAKYHPKVTQDALQDWNSRSGEGDPQLSATAKVVIEEWAREQSTVDLAMDLLKTMLKTNSLAQLPIDNLIKKRPMDMVDLILNSEEKVDLPSIHSWPYRNLPIDRLLPLMDRYSDFIYPTTLEDLKPEQRRAVFEMSKIGWRNNDGEIPKEAISALPVDLRIKEARRHIKLSVYEVTPKGKVPFIALLPWDEAIELQKPFLRSADADVRGSAFKCQISAAKYDSSRIGDMLQIALKGQNEQSTVRSQMILGLCQIPGSRWKESHLEDLGTVIRHGLDASDMARDGPFDLLDILSRILPYHPKWAAKQMAVVMKEHPPSYPRDIRFSGTIKNAEVVKALGQELNPWLKKASENTDEYGDAIDGLGSALGTNARYWPEFVETLEKMLHDADNSTRENDIFPLLKIIKSRSWFEILPQLLDEEGSDFLNITHVDNYISQHDQRRLNTILKDDPSPFFDLKSGFHRWSATQQETFAKALAKSIKEEDTSTQNKQQHIRQLAKLAFVDIEHLTELANEESQIIREGAVRALGKVDGQGGVPTLIEALRDDRARWSIYSLRRSFKAISNSESLKSLQEVSLTKVTVAKEAIRMIGDLETEEALQYLLKLDKTELQIDVRVALLRALWLYLDRDETWEIFTRAAKGTDPVIAKAASNIPQDGMTKTARHNSLKLFLILIQHTSGEVRLATLQRIGGKDILIEDPESILVPRLLELLQSPHEKEIEAAATALFKTYARNDPQLIASAFKKALSNRKTLKLLHETYLENCDPNVAKHMVPATQRVLEVLKTDRLGVTMRLKLIFGGLPWTELHTHLLEIIPELHADALVKVEKLIADEYGWRGNKCEFKEARTRNFEIKLAGSKDDRARRLAVEFLSAGVSDDRGWNEGQRKRLLMYREDESVMVAEAAWAVNLPEKEEEEEEGETEESKE